MSSLMDSLGNAITPELTSSLAQHFSLPPDGVDFSLQASAAAVLSALAARTKDVPFLSSIYDLVTGSNFASSPPPTEPSQSGPASSFLQTLFGTHMPDVEAEIARTADIPTDAAGASLTAVAPLVMTILSDRISGGGLTLASFGETLASQLPQLKSFLPEGFSVPAIPGLNGVEDARSPVRRAPSRAAADHDNYKAGWLWPVLLSGAILIPTLIWYFGSASATSAASDTETKSTPIVEATPSRVAPPGLGNFTDRQLPDGISLNIPENGIESKLLAFIEDSSKPVDITTWFDFDRLLFATGSDQLEPSSNEQLQNIARILKAFPNVHARIGGYTDNTGNAEANVTLSQNRASNVRIALIALGVAPDRLDARGYGEQHPVGDNSTESGRAQNRRISLRVTEK